MQLSISRLSSDFVAGVTLAAYAIPVSLAYATLAGLPPQVGVYGYLMGGLGYALAGSSRYLAIGPTSAISLMIAGTVGEMAGDDMAGRMPPSEGTVLLNNCDLHANFEAVKQDIAFVPQQDVLHAEYHSAREWQRRLRFGDAQCRQADLSATEQVMTSQQCEQGDPK